MLKEETTPLLIHVLWMDVRRLPGWPPTDIVAQYIMGNGIVDHVGGEHDLKWNITAYF